MSLGLLDNCLRLGGPSVAQIAFSQAADKIENDTVRVTVSVNTDRSHTVYKFVDARHKAVATTTGRDGKVREEIRYELDAAQDRLQLRFSRKADWIFDFCCLRQANRPDIRAAIERFCFAEKGANNGPHSR